VAEPPKDAILPPSAADRAKLAALEKAGAGVHGPEADGGYVVRVERDTKLAPALASLRGLNCVGNLSLDHPDLTDADLAALDGLTQLHSLVVQCPRALGRGFAVLAKFPRLASLAVIGPVTDDVCQPVAAATGLVEVRFVGVQVTDSGLAELRSLPLLESLGLEGAKVTGTGFAGPGWAKLREIDLTQSTVQDVAALASLPALQMLKLSGTRVTDAGLHRLAGLKLTDLDLSDTRVTDTGVRSLGKVDALRTLDLSGTAVSGAAFDSLPTSLRKLTLDGTKFDDAGAAHLSRLSELATLSAARCPVSDAGLASLGKLSKLTKVTLAGTGAGDGTARVLGALPALEVAGFDRTALTDAGLRELARAPRLRFVEARGTKVTKKGAADAVKFGPDGLRVEAG
jgi:hypothetical protein